MSFPVSALRRRVQCQACRILQLSPQTIYARSQHRAFRTSHQSASNDHPDSSSEVPSDVKASPATSNSAPASVAIDAADEAASEGGSAPQYVSITTKPVDGAASSHGASFRIPILKAPVQKHRQPADSAEGDEGEYQAPRAQGDEDATEADDPVAAKAFREGLREFMEVDLELETIPSVKPPKELRGFEAEGEDVEDIGYKPDQAFMADDVTSIAHGELQRHREMRHYARLSAWQLPMLAQYAVPFTPPQADRPLRFRYTSYLGEDHPAAKKVTVEFCSQDLPLEPAQRLKLVKLLGARYDPQTDKAKLSCESFPSPAQNKRHLGEVVDNLISEARDPADDFADVPVDFRHVKWKRQLAFPKEWQMTPGRKLEVEQIWTSRLEAERARISQNGLVDGRNVVQRARTALAGPQTTKRLAAESTSTSKTAPPPRRGSFASRPGNAKNRVKAEPVRVS